MSRATGDARPWSRLGALHPGVAAYGLAFALGILALHRQADLPTPWPAALAALLLAVAALRLPLLAPAAVAAGGFGWAAFHACLTLCHPFPDALARETVELTGRVASIPVASADGGRRFLFDVESARREDAPVAFTGRVRLSWHRDPPQLRAGERRRLCARLKPPHGYANPGGFDFEGWLFQQRVLAIGSVRPCAGSAVLDPGPGPRWLDRTRQALAAHIDRVLGPGSAAGMVRALVLGDAAGLAPAEWEVLTRTGTNHLISISGLHVGLVAGFVFFLVRRLWCRSARLALALAAPRAAAGAAFAAAVAYSALAGFAVPTQRSLVMLAVVLGGVALARTVRPVTGLATALIAVLALDPGAVLSPGFWLSFGAVAVLVYALARRLPGGGWWTRWGKAQWAVGVGLLPLLFLFFGRASLVSPLANLVAVPVFSLLLPAVLVATVLSLVPGLSLPLVGVGALLSMTLDALELVAAWPWAAGALPRPAPWIAALALAGVALLLAPRGLPGRWTGVPLMLPLVLVRPPLPGPGEAWLTLLDVGQGLSAVVRTRHHLLVYDTGPAFPGGFETGSAVVLPYLREIGAPRIDVLILSHADRDHAGGFPGLDRRIAIGRVLSGEPGELPPRAGAQQCRAGEGWEWDGVRFELLHPAGPGLTGNDSSCVLRVAAAGASVLLPGDAGAGVERRLAAALGPALASTVLVAGHHGSNTSTSAAFLEAVSPRLVLYASGYANRFGFPTPKVRARVRESGAVELDTAATGAIALRLGPTGAGAPALHRRDARRLWTHRVPGAPF